MFHAAVEETAEVTLGPLAEKPAPRGVAHSQIDSVESQSTVSTCDTSASMLEIQTALMAKFAEKMELQLQQMQLQLEDHVKVQLQNQLQNMQMPLSTTTSASTQLRPASMQIHASAGMSTLPVLQDPLKERKRKELAQLERQIEGEEAALLEFRMDRAKKMALLRAELRDND